MISFCKSLFPLLIMVLLATAGFSQLPDLKFSHLDARNGLPTSSINVIVKDSVGYMWIGTRNGLCRYDGYNYKTFRHNYNDPQSLPDNDIISLLVTPDNQLWISTLKGICSYNRRTGEFDRPVFPQRLAQKNATESKIYLQDKHGYIWFDEFLHQSLVGYNPLSRDYKVLDFFVNDGGGRVTSMFEDNKGDFWVSRYRAFYHYHTQTKKIEKVISTHNTATYFNVITAFTQAADSTLWTTNWGGGLAHYNPISHQTDHYLVEQVKQFVGTKNVLDYPIWIKDPTSGKTNLWTLSEYGLLCFDTTVHKFSIYHPDIHNAYANKLTFTVSQFAGGYYDRKQSILWCWGPYGIDICDFSIQNLQTFLIHTQSIAELPGSIDGFINNIDNNDEYFLSCFASNQLLIYNEATRIVKTKTFPLKGIPVLFQPGPGILWMSSERSVWEWNIKQDFLHDISAKVGLLKNPIARAHRVNCYLKDSWGNIWIGSNGGGICRYQPGTNSCNWVVRASQSGGLTIPSPQIITQFVETAGGRIMALDNFKGLFEISAEGKIIDLYIPDNLPAIAALQKTEALTFDNMTYDGKQRLWVNTNAGLLLYNIQTHHFSLADTRHQLPEGRADNIILDKYGYLWLSYTDQLFVFDPLLNRVRIFNYRNGYQGSPDGCNFLVNNRHELRLGYEDHIEHVNRDPFNKLRYPLPKVLITSAGSGGKMLPNDDLFSPKRAVEVSYKNNELELEYALPLYHNPDELTYSYKLAGYDHAWIDAGTAHKVRYTNLPGGNYQFLLKAYDPGSGLYSPITTLAVVVYPPFWETWWFIVLCAALFFGLVYLVYRYRINQLLRLERMRVAISADLHDELGSTLSSISIYSNVARRMADVNRAESQKYLERIEASSREMIDSMSDIVWSINPANDDPAKILERMRLYAYEVLGASDVNLHWMKHPALNIDKMKMDQRKNLYLIFKEGINNIAKYAAATDVHIEISTVGNLLYFQLRDNGVGFDTVAGRQGNGLKTMQLRSNLLKGQLRISSQPGKGTQLELKFPLA